jgi:hypothetical protein
MKRPLLVAFALAASVSFAHAQDIICDSATEFCPEEDLGADSKGDQR